MSKKVLFIYKNQSLARPIVYNLRKLGFDVYEFYEDYIPYGNLTLRQKVKNVFYRFFFKDVNFIHKIHEINFKNHSIKLLKKLKNKFIKFDYCLVLRGDKIPIEVLDFARKISFKMYDYQCDGLGDSNDILKNISLFDQVYVFDTNDIKNHPNYNLKYASNFFYEDKIKEPILWDFYYIGVGVENRYKYLKNFIGLNNFEDNVKFNLNLGSKGYNDSEKIKFLSDNISYMDNLLNVKQSKVLLDIKLESHDGLSFRFFEALNYNKKIITNNKYIISCDFYHPNNVFVTDYNNFQGLQEFLELPYVYIDPIIKEKYNFKNWIKYIFEEDNLI